MVTTNSRVREFANSNLGMKNIITRDEFIPLMTKTIQDIVTILTSSCGRNSRFNLVITPEVTEFSTADSAKLNIFSKDGAHLVDSIKFASPIQTYIKNMLVYIGNRVDSMCGDGTTTSMMFAGMFLMRIFETLHLKDGNEFATELSKMTTVEITEMFRELSSEILEALKEKVITIDTLKNDLNLTEKEAMNVFAYTQAMTSSNGDVELAEALGTAFEHVPYGFVDNMYQIYPELEREKRIEVLVEDVQFKIEYPILVTPGVLNHNLHREYLKDNVSVACFPRGIPDSSPQTTELLRYIDSRKDSDDHIVIIAPEFGHEVAQHINEINKFSGKNNIAVIISGKPGNRFTHLPLQSVALCGVMNTPMYSLSDDIEITDIDKCFHHGVTIHYTNKYVNLSNLYPEEEGYAGHPGMLYPEQYPYYVKARDILYTTKERIESHHRKEKGELEEIREALSAIEYTKRISIIGGGNTLTQVASRLVIEDCISASICSINGGFLTNGFSRLTHAAITDVDSKSGVKRMFCDAIYVASRAINTIIYGTEDYAYPGDKYMYINSSDPDCTYNYEDFIQNKMNNEAEDMPSAPVQSYRMFVEMFSRIEELILKLIMSENILIVGELWDDKGDKDANS